MDKMVRKDNRVRWGWLALGVAALAGSAVVAGVIEANRRAGANPRDTAPSHTKKGTLLNDTADLGSTITIARPKSEIFDFLRNVDNWPRVMTSLRAVENLDEQRWRLQFGKSGHGTEVRINEDQAGGGIFWKSDNSAMVEAEGSILLQDARGGRGTELAAHVAWRPPGGAIGRPFVKLFSEKQGRREIKRLKMFLETGEIATARNRAEPA